MKTLIIRNNQFNLTDSELSRLLATTFWDTYKKTYSTEIQRQYHFKGIDTFDIVESVYDASSVKEIVTAIGGKGR